MKTTMAKRAQRIGLKQANVASIRASSNSSAHLLRFLPRRPLRSTWDRCYVLKTQEAKTRNGIRFRVCRQQGRSTAAASFRFFFFFTVGGCGSSWCYIYLLLISVNGGTAVLTWEWRTWSRQSWPFKGALRFAPRHILSVPVSLRSENSYHSDRSDHRELIDATSQKWLYSQILFY